jgi:hypothetical protein
MDSGLHVHEKVYLLQCDPGTNRLRDRSVVAPKLVRAGALADLAIHGVVEDLDGRVHAVDGREASDPLSRLVLDSITSSKPRKWKDWIQRDGGKSLDVIEHQLHDKGVITLVRKKIFFVFPAREIRINDPSLLPSIRDDVRAVALGVEPVEQISAERATLAALVSGAEMRSVISRGESRQAKKRIEEIMDSTGPFGPALKRAIRDTQGAIVGATVAATAAATAGS